MTLSGCASDGTGIDAEALIPKALTTCTDAPAVPARPVDAQGHQLPRTDVATGGYIAGLHGAYDDCKSTVAAIAARRQALDDQAAGRPHKGVTDPATGAPVTGAASGLHISLIPLH